MTEHIAKKCNVKDCEQEASYWIDTSEGFVESLLDATVPHTFYLCIDHQYELDGKDVNEGGYVHLRIDTGELYWREIGKYSCSEECDVCRV
jgi:hypothetical protein